MLTGDPAVCGLAAEVARYPNVAALGDWHAAACWRGETEAPPGDALLVPWRVRPGGAELSFFTTLTTFGTPRDITLAELAVELFYPADDSTAEALRRWPA